MGPKQPIEVDVDCPDNERTSLLQQKCRQLTVDCLVASAPQFGAAAAVKRKVKVVNLYGSSLQTRL